MISSLRILWVVPVLVLANAYPTHMTASQVVWEQIRKNQQKRAEAKKAVTPPVAAVQQHEDSAVIVESKVHQVRASPQKKGAVAGFVQKKHQGVKGHVSIPHQGPKRRVVTRANKPVGRKATKPQRPQPTNMKSQLKHIAQEVAALKKQRNHRAANSVSQKHLSAKERQPFVDKVWKPPSKKVEKPQAIAAVEPSGQDPFSAMPASFKSEQSTEMKKAANLLKAKHHVEPKVAEDINEEVNDEVKKTTKAVEAIAGADDVSESTKKDLKTSTTDAYKGLESMEADAKDLVVAADEDAEKEAQEGQAKAKAALKADQVLKEDLSEVKKVKEEKKPAPAKKVETLADAKKEVRAAENLEEMSKVSEGLASEFVKGDRKLNSELAEDVAMNNRAVRTTMRRVQTIEDNKKADLLDGIDAQWRKQFPDAPSAKDDAKATQRQMQQGTHKKAVSEWGTLANNLANGVVA